MGTHRGSYRSGLIRPENRIRNLIPSTGFLQEGEDGKYIVLHLSPPEGPHIKYEIQQQGLIPITEEVAHSAGIKDSVVIIGCIDRFYIADPENWQRYLQRLRQVQELDFNLYI